MGDLANTKRFSEKADVKVEDFGTAPAVERSRRVGMNLRRGEVVGLLMYAGRQF